MYCYNCGHRDTCHEEIGCTGGAEKCGCDDFIADLGAPCECGIDGVGPLTCPAHKDAAKRLGK